jgi:phosphoenolpyruvate-protein kinase (PTS system EI component)
LQADFIYDKHSDLFLVSDEVMNETSLPEIAATVIGREIKRITANNAQLQERLKRIIQGHIALAEDSSFTRNMVEETGKTVEEVLIWVNALLKGITT